jgi:type IV pilus assembly protein PilP
VSHKQFFVRIGTWGAVGVAVLGLVGCGDSKTELQQWMEQQQRDIKPSVSPLQAPKKFTPQPYLAARSVEPFSTQKLKVTVDQNNRQLNALLASEMNRRKEPLEAFPLDSITLVGSVNQFGRREALLRVDRLLYKVKVGEYIGQNNGRIKEITETSVTFRELVFDSSGEMVERMSSLQLQESAR